jgi:hypothetical protein
MAAMRRSLAALAAAVVLVSACGGSKESKPAQAPPSRSPIPQGSYPYLTTGFERLSAVVSSRHVYPRRSSVTVEADACGYSERWEPRPERVSEWRFCTNGKRWRLAEIVDYHEFFGQATTQRFTCRGRFVPRPPTVRIGFHWTDRCRGAGSRVTVDYRAVRDQAIRVAGKRVETVLIHTEARLRGRIDGLNVYDSCLARANGLLIRRKVVSRTAIDTPFGTVHDRERYTLALQSLVPS